MPVPEGDLAAIRPSEGRVYLRALEGAADLGERRAAVDLGANGVVVRPGERTLHLLELQQASAELARDPPGGPQRRLASSLSPDRPPAHGDLELGGDDPACRRHLHIPRALREPTGVRPGGMAIAAAGCKAP